MTRNSNAMLWHLRRTLVPFKSQAQRKWMYANEPGMAKRWEAETPKDKKLKKKVKKNGK
jgi:hypothetical protein